jgi:hypothetical protein
MPQLRQSEVPFQADSILMGITACASDTSTRSGDNEIYHALICIMTARAIASPE